MVFGGGLLLLCMFSRSVHIVARISTSFPFVASLPLRGHTWCCLCIPPLRDIWVVPSLPSTPGSWFTPPTSSATRTVLARLRSTRGPRATTTPARRSLPSSRWVLAPELLLRIPRGGSGSGPEKDGSLGLPRGQALPCPLSTLSSYSGPIRNPFCSHKSKGKCSLH